MITMDKGIIIVMGTNDVFDCHWVKAIMTEINTKKIQYEVFYQNIIKDRVKNIVSYILG